MDQNTLLAPNDQLHKVQSKTETFASCPVIKTYWIALSAPL